MNVALDAKVAAAAKAGTDAKAADKAKATAAAKYATDAKAAVLTQRPRPLQKTTRQRYGSRPKL